MRPDASVAVLGCGPAGLLVAHAVVRAGYKPHVYSVKTKSKIGGAQYLHEAIPVITDSEPDGEVMFLKEGNRDCYAEKVYGDVEAPVSWDDFDRGLHGVWNMQAAYSLLWAMYEPAILDATVTEELVDGLGLLDSTILSTIPPKAYCKNPDHSFISQSVWISRERRCNDMEILYDGTPNHDWYRASNMWGFSYTEYPHVPDNVPAVHVQKPLKTDCDCHPEVVRLGRYGRWEKKQLIHNAYFDAVEALNALQ